MPERRDRPIRFDGPMVRAVLAGTKTQSRSVVTHLDRSRTRLLGGISRSRVKGYLLEDASDRAAAAREASPFGEPGDRLWVRETWKSSEYGCDEEPQQDDHECTAHCAQTYVYYAATPRVGFRPKPDGARVRYLDDSSPLTDWYTSGWRPSIHMPRWASRITLEVTEVRIERLKSISEADALAEGVDPYEWQGGPANPCAVPAFAEVWDRTDGKRAPWASNPWVWVVAFKRLEVPNAT